MFVEADELTLELESYITAAEITTNILPIYTLEELISQVGKSGEFSDVLDRPNTLLVDEFEEYKSFVLDEYITEFLVAEKLEVATINLKSEITLKVTEMYITAFDLDAMNFARQDDIDALSEVARSGEYDDILNTPNLSVYMPSANIYDEYVDNSEFESEIQKYVKVLDVATVGKTGEFSDLIDEPDVSLYQKKQVWMHMYQ